MFVHVAETTAWFFILCLFYTILKTLQKDTLGTLKHKFKLARYHRITCSVRQRKGEEVWGGVVRGFWRDSGV